MPSTQEILDAAKKVGQMVAEHDATKKLESALKALESDTDAQRAIADFNRHLQTLAQKEQSGKPIEVQDKQKLESLQQAVVMNINLRNFQTAQMDYVDLLRKIDDAITSQSSDALAAIGGAAPGNGGPGSGTPGSGAPGSGTPGSGGPGSGAPGSGGPGSGAEAAASPLINPDLAGGMGGLGR